MDEEENVSLVAEELPVEEQVIQDTRITLGSIIGSKPVEEFENFNMTEVQYVLSKLSFDQVIDEGSALLLAQQSLNAADILIEFIAKLTKSVSILDSKVTNLKNKVALAYKTADGRTTAEMKKQAGESDPGVLSLQEQLAKAKGAKAAVEYKYEVVVKAHHHFKDLAGGHRKLHTNSLTVQPKADSGGWG